ncbi:MAG TPA: hypothetical protein DEP35_12810 [Deltaproteobacteria bacterium]|jgi:hypothetical protein|nr:hypothetical protein [Deltaproteobacteria bacterium]
MSNRSLFIMVSLFCMLTAIVARGDSNERSSQDEGIEFKSTITVSDDAIERAQYIVDQMLSNASAIREKMKAIGFKVEIIGKDQVLSDLPDYSNLKGKTTLDGRDYDKGTRGVGSKKLCSVGEENLLCLPGQRYRDEDVLVHEFSHSIMAHLDVSTQAMIDLAYENASESKLYPDGIYMMRNSREYWAEGTQAWFDVTRRHDVNGGYNTREKLKDHDPQLASLLEQVYGSTRISRYHGCAY